MSAAWVFIGSFLVAYFLKCKHVKKATIPIGLLGSVVIAYWIWERRNIEHVQWYGIVFLTSIPVVFSYMWNEKLYDMLIDEHKNLKIILSSCTFLKIGLFLLSLLLFAVGRLCLIDLVAYE